MRFAAFVFPAILAISVSAHSAIINVKGANGVNGVGMGITDTTGQQIPLFNQSPRFVGDQPAMCGSQALEGRRGPLTPVAVNAQVAQISAAALPTPDANGVLNMDIFQVNGDGAGPYTCEVSASATGTDFQPATVVTDVPGRRGRSGADDEVFPFAVQVPANIQCTGPNGSCMLRCISALRRNPFGGCVVFAGNNNTAAARRSLFGRRSLHNLIAERELAARIAAEDTTPFTPEEDIDDVDPEEDEDEDY